MTAEQVLRCAILKQYRQLTYEELAFHLEDSDSFRSFARLEMRQYPCKSILQQNIKALREDTWEAIHREIISYANKETFRLKAFRDLLVYAGKVREYALAAIPEHHAHR